MSDELDFEGARVRLKDDALNLTDMWRAAGRQRRSHLPNGRDNLKRLSLLILSPILWARSIVFRAYAKYLSPALHAWFNSIVRAHMERRATNSFQHQVIERLDRIEHRVDTLEPRLPQRRREIGKTTRIRLANATFSPSAAAARAAG
jgi:hypothetical protein